MSSILTTISLLDHDIGDEEDVETLIITGITAFGKKNAWREDAGSN